MYVKGYIRMNDEQDAYSFLPAFPRHLGSSVIAKESTHIEVDMYFSIWTEHRGWP